MLSSQTSTAWPSCQLRAGYAVASCPKKALGDLTGYCIWCETAVAGKIYHDILRHVHLRYFGSQLLSCHQCLLILLEFAANGIEGYFLISGSNVVAHYGPHFAVIFLGSSDKTAEI